MKIPSIFNDVIGPIMRGPSSSHCAAAVRIGKIARDLMDGKIEKVLVEFDPNGSLATTHKTQGSDMGLFGGLLGWDATDVRLVDAENAINQAGIEINIQITEFPAHHPSTYQLTLKNEKETHILKAISTGGGMVEIVEIDNEPLLIEGDYSETLIFIRENGELIRNYLIDRVSFDEIFLHHTQDTHIIEIKAQHFLPIEFDSLLKQEFGECSIKRINPVLPIKSRKNMEVPFLTCDEMINYNHGKDLDLWELAVHYESARGNITYTQVITRMEEIVRILKDAIQIGLNGTEYDDRILGFQSGNFKTKMETNGLLDAGVLNLMILYTTALMEVKSSMGIIVAAPTAGACGGLPGACIGAADFLKLSMEDIVKAMLAAGIIGVFIATHATFAAEVGGCQAECGSGSGMAAAALVTLAKGSPKQAIAASSIALQNILGMICDPVANRVEVPCLGKNAMAVSNALTCANMALADFDPVIPLDQVISTMNVVGKSLPASLRCTGLGGLSITQKSHEIEKQLRSQ
jgi:L-serine dehydratase